jgi:type VI secretion system protein ImpF
MPDSPHTERIQPSLLERLTDYDPGVKEESRRQRVVPPERYVRSVVLDLLRLFNVRTHSLESLVLADDLPCATVRRQARGASLQNQARSADLVLADFPEVSRSVLTFGIPDLIGVLSTDLVVTQLARDLEDAVRFFEPRLNPRTLRIKPVLLDNGQSDKPTATSICFELVADVLMEPKPEHLHLKTVIDLETGQCELLETRHEPKVS